MQTELHQLIDALPSAGVIRAGKLGLELAPVLSLEEHRALLSRLTHLTRSTAGHRHTLTAWLGDLLVHGKPLRRGQITDCALAAGLEPGTLRNAKLVCTRILPSCRHDALSWSHHCEVALAFMAPADIERWLTLAETEALATNELRRRIRAHLAGARPVAPDSQPPFIFDLMRELRAAARVADQRRNLWHRWPPSACRRAVEELQPLLDFVERIRARGGQGEAGRN